MASLPSSASAWTSQNAYPNCLPSTENMAAPESDFSLCEYTARHRNIWPLLLRGRDAETLHAPELSSWLRLWGRFGGELFRCFRMGDAHIRSDMIARARADGGWRGQRVALALEQWRQQLGDH